MLSSFLALTLLATPPTSVEPPLRLLVPSEGNLQLLALWLARELDAKAAASYELMVPPSPSELRQWLESGGPGGKWAQAVDAAILPAPVLLEAIARERPMRLVANLLAHDPINLVVRSDVAKQRGLTRDLPLEARLRRLEGAQIGIGPHPEPRLEALFKSAGLDARRRVKLHRLHGSAQNVAFGAGRVDALFAHTPFLEFAIADQGGVLLVDCSSGEVSALADRAIHVLVGLEPLSPAARRALDDLHHSIVRAIAEARNDPSRARRQLGQAFSNRDPRALDVIFPIYLRALPMDTSVTVERLERALALYPAHRPVPALSRAQLEKAVGGEE